MQELNVLKKLCYTLYNDYIIYKNTIKKTKTILFQYGDTPLHTGARYGHAGVIRILVSAKCNPSEQNKVTQNHQNKPYKPVLEHKVQSIRTKQGKTSLSEQNKVKQTYQNETRLSEQNKV
jgi:ankyrin repeat protein